MTPDKKAEAACKRLVEKHGPNKIASICINPKTGDPISRQAVEHWSVIPLVHLRTLAAFNGCEPKELRPDLWEYVK